jgi:enoyl-CoA hydratase/carnithine racemase
MARPTPSKILNEVEDGVAVLTLNRPASLNAFDEELRREFTEAVRGLAADAEVGAVVVTGTGRAFSAGGDIREMPERLDGPAGEIGPRGWSRLILNASFETTLEQSFAASNQAQAICYTTADHRRLVEAFMSARSKK